MKRKIVFAVLAVALSGSVVFAATGGVGAIRSAIEISNMNADQPLDKIYNTIEWNEEQNPAEWDFIIQAKTILEKTYSGNEIYDALYRTAYWVQVFQPEQQTLEYFLQLLEEGFHPEAILNAYSLWLDTDEDITVIEKTLPLCEEDCSPSNIEHSMFVLLGLGNGNDENLRRFMEENALGADVYFYARKFAMKKIYSVQEILELKQEKAWVEILQNINKRSDSKWNLAEIETINISDEDIEILSDAITLSQITGASVKQCYLIFTNEKQEYSLSDYFEEHSEGINKLLHEIGVSYEKEESAEEMEFRQFCIDHAKENGMTESDIEALHDSGVSYLDILNASEAHQVTGESISDILKEVQ